MAFTGVPMMIGGGQAEHSADLMRQLVADFFYGSEGVIRDTDLAIKPLPAADDAVRMTPGGVAVLNRALGGDREAYYDFNDQDDTIPIEGTGSSGGRSDLIVAQVEDPWAAGTQYQYPTDRKKGPYIFPRVIPNVSRKIYNVHQLPQARSAVTLARIDQPANNNAITSAMIVDLRSIANGPQRWQEPDPPEIPSPPQVDQATWTESRIQAVSQTLNYTDRTFINWPSSANWRVPIPPWANGVDMFCVVQNPAQWTGNVFGETRMGIDSVFGTPMKFDMDAISTVCPNRIPLFYSTTIAWSRASGFAGSVRTFKFQARMFDDAKTRGRMIADTSTVMYINLSFKRFPVIN